MATPKAKKGRSKANDLCCCEMKALRAEIDRRARGQRSSPVRSLSIPVGGALANAPTNVLVEELRGRQRAIYGTDDRKDIFQVTDAKILKVADSVVALVDAANLKKKNGRFRLKTTVYQEDCGLCASEPFATQPLGCDCSGFLVAPDVIATAGHCVTSKKALAKIRFVFGFRMINSKRARTDFGVNDVYEGAELIGRAQTDTGADWALVRLTRPVVGRAPVKVRTAGKITKGRTLFVIGHPNGLPAKFADKAQVRANSRPSFFVANLDTYGGNSGSPVFDAATRVVEGILVRGETDFVTVGDCDVSMICSEADCRGEDVTRSTVWAGRIPS